MTAKKLSFTVTPEYADHFAHLASELGMKKTDLLKKAVAMFEDYAYMNILDKRMEEYRAGDLKPIDFGELEQAVTNG